MKDYIEDLNEMIVYAENSGNLGIVDTLDRVKVEEVVGVLRSLGDEFGFDQVTLDEILETPFGQAFEMAYGYLVQAGLEAEEVLEVFLEEK